MVKKSKLSVSKTPLSLLQWFGFVLIALGGLMATLLILEVVITAPTIREHHLYQVWWAYHEKNKTDVPLAELVPWPWEKACLIEAYPLNTEAIRQRYGEEVSTWHMSGEFLTSQDNNTALILYPKDSKPWALKADTSPIKNMKDGDCVNRDYIVLFN